MKTTILFSADWHIDQSNIRYTLPAVDALVKIARERKPDLVVHGGDYFVHRGSIHPEINWVVRDRLHELAAAAGGRRIVFDAVSMLAISGNHDQVFQHGMHDGLAGAVAVASDQDDIGRGIVTATTATGPRVVIVDGDGGDTGTLSFVLIPTVNKYWLHSQTETEDKLDAGALLDSMVQSLILAEKAQGRTPIVVYHGTFAGARTGNEQVMTAGMDIALPQTAVNGAAIVLAGHIHHAQELDGPGCKIYYPGSIAPLTWNDKKLEPRALLVEVEHDEGGRVQGVDVEAIPLPVVSQMVESEITANACWYELPVADVLDEHVLRSGARAGDRLRLKIAAPGASLSQITDNLLDQLAAKYQLEHIKAIRERSDADRIEFAANRRIGIAEAFCSWLQLQAREDLTDQERGDLIALVRQLEEQVQDEHLDACYDYQPETLRAINWCQYGEFQIDFEELGSLVAIRGANTAGKSNAVRALLFALYKHQVAGDVLRDLIRKGERQAEVVHTFHSHGDRYRIRRVLKRSGERGATAQLFFERGDEDEQKWYPLAEGDARETEQAIRALIGPPELFLATTYAGQADVDGLLDLGPAELRDLLQSVLQRDFAGRQKLIRTWAAYAEKQADRHRTLMERAAGESARAAQLEVDLEVTRGRLAGHQAELAKIDLSALEAALRCAQERAAELRGRLAAIPAADAPVAIRERLATAEKAVVAAQERLAGARAAAAAHAQHLEEEPPTADVGAAEAALAQADTALRETKACHHDEQRKLWERLDSLAAEHRTAHHAWEKAKRDLDFVATQLQDLERRALLIDEVPCGGNDWVHPGAVADPDQYSDELIDMSTCPLLADALSSRNSIETYSEYVRKGESQVQELGAEVQRALEALGKARNEDSQQLDQRHKAEASALQAALDDAKRVAEQARQAEAKRAFWTAQEALLRGKAERAGEYEAAVQEAEARVREAAEAVRAATGSIEARAAAERELSQASLDASAAEKDLGRAQRDEAIAKSAAEQAAADIARLEAQLEAATKAAAEVSEHRTAIAGLERRGRHCSILLDALGRDGVPQLLLEQFALPELRSLVNSYLEETSFSVEIEAQRQLVSGEGKPGVYLTFTDHRGTHPISAASGQQRVALGSALRNALAALHAQALGSRIWLTVQDEGFGALDPENREAAKVTLRRIAKDRRWFLYISHVEGLSEIADNVLEAVSHNGASKLEVVR